MLNEYVISHLLPFANGRRLYGQRHGPSSKMVTIGPPLSCTSMMASNCSSQPQQKVTFAKYSTTPKRIPTR
ncbi:hypothetical protein L484_019009 [Morus notabilis]|uniref:Uncharacterized protein n=1 Tax=Morus notabilis TaxID=981085 RepID=W9R4N0_9ROSA|nr:hypothetical protein L484_019009 [Morus notabilis]